MALTKIPNNLITADAIDGTLIANNAINSEHYTDGSIDTAHIAADQITSALIADDQIDSEHIVDGSIDLAHMSVNSIDSDQYVDGSIDLVHMSVNSIDSDQYVDGSIDNAHLADDAIGIAELSATGTASSSTFLRGDNSWQSAADGTKLPLAGGTMTGNLDINGNQLILDADADTSIRESADDYLIMKVGGTDLIKIDASGIGIGIRPAEMLDIQSASGDARIRLDAPAGSDTEVKFFNAGSAQYTIGHDDATDNFVIGGANVDTPYLALDKSANVNITGTIKENDIPTRSRAIAMAMVFG